MLDKKHKVSKKSVIADNSLLLNSWHQLDLKDFETDMRKAMVTAESKSLPQHAAATVFRSLWNS